MRERDRRGGWQQLLTLMGIGSIPEEEWEDICMSYQLSWDRIHYINLGKRVRVGAVAGKCPSPVVKHRNSTAPGRAVASSHVKRRKASASPSAPEPSPIKRRNSLAPPSTPNRPPFSKGQAWDSSLGTPKRRNSVAAHGFNTPNHTEPLDNLLPSPIKPSPVFGAIDCQEFMPITPISPISPPIKRRDSVALDQKMNRKQSGSSLASSAPSAPKRRDSSVSASARVKSKSSKPLEKPISIVKHVTGSGDELDDDQMLVLWKKYNEQKRAKLKAKSLGTLKNGRPPQKLPGDIKVEPPVKRKRGRPSREEVARRLEEEQALKLMNETSNQFLLPKKQSNPVWTKQEEDNDLDQKLEAPPDQAQEPPRAHQKPPKQREQQKPTSGPTIKSIKSSSKALKQQQQQQPAAKPRCRSTSPVSDQGGADKLSNVAILHENAILPAHMPTMAIDLKCRSTVPPGNNEREEEEEEEEDEDDDDVVRPKPNPTAYEINRRHCRSMYSKILGTLSSDEDEQLILSRKDFMFNDVEADGMLVDDAMELTSPVGGGEGDKDDLDIDLDLDFHVRDENVANQIALIDRQEEMSINRCLEAFDTHTQSPSEIDKCLENFGHKSPSEIDPPSELTHTSEFFEELSSRPPVNVTDDKNRLLWPFKDEDEVLDYEADLDVLTLGASSDELDEEAPSKARGEPKPSEESEPRSQSNLPNSRMEPPQPELPPRPVDKPSVPDPGSLRTFRIPKVQPEVLKAQPTVMHSLYEQEDQEQNKKPKKKRSPKTVPTPTPTPAQPAVTDDVRKMREEARAARRIKETNPKFGPCYRSVAEGLTPNYGPEDLAPMFGPEDLAPLQAVADPPSHRHSLPGGPPYQPSREAAQYAPENFVPMSGPPSNRHSLPEMPSSRPSREASQYVPENLATSNRNILPAGEPFSRPAREASQYVPENLATSSRDCRPANGSASMRTASFRSIPIKHWMMEVFGAKCLQFLDNKCLSPDCDHSMSSEGEVESRLFSMTKEALDHTYRQALRSFSIFGRYFKSFADIFERRNLGQHLLQMLANCRLYRATAAPFVGHIFGALQRCGMEREAVRCIMTDLWFPDKAHKFRDLTLLILEILEAANWQDYIVQLMDLHNIYRFLLNEEFLVRILKWAEATKNEALQKNAMIMVTLDLQKYARSSTLLALIRGISQAPSSDNHNTNPNFILEHGRQPGAGPGPSPVRIPVACGQPQQQYPGTSWNPNTNNIFVTQLERQPGAGPASGQQQPYSASTWIHSPNPSLVSQPDRLPGAGPGPSLIQPQQYPAQMWSHSPSPSQQHLPGAGPAARQQQQQNPAPAWNRNLIPNLVPQPDRLPGASPAAGQQQQNPASFWNHSQNLASQHDQLLGALTGPSLIQRCPAPGQQQQQQQYPEANWRNQANNFNRADDNQYRHYPQGFQ